MARQLSRVCHCGDCRRRDARECAAVVAASYSPRELRELEREYLAATIEDLERAFAAPAAVPAAAACEGTEE